MKRVGALIVVLLVIGVGYLAYHRWFGGASAPQQGGAMPAMTATVEKVEYKPVYHFTGRLKAVTEAEVRPQVAGLVEKIHFKEGQMVKAGQPLVTLDLRTFKAAAGQGAAQVEQARLAYQRGVVLRAQDAISTADLESRKAAWQAAEAFATQARVDLDHAVVKAPISGRVGRAEVTLGNVVDAGGGAPVLTTIQQIDPVYVDFEVNEQTYLSLVGANAGDTPDLSNAPVAVGLANDGTEYPLEGKLSAVDNRFGDGSGSLRMRATLDNKNGALLPGLFARVQLTVPQTQTATLVNDSAIGTDQANRFVWKVGQDGTAQYQKVEMGDLVDGMRVIKGGLQAGDKIIVNGLMMIHPGVPVTPVPTDMKTLQPISPTSPAAAPMSETTVSTSAVETTSLTTKE